MHSRSQKRGEKKLGKKLHLVQKTVASPINNTSCQENIIPEVLCVLAFCPTPDPLQGASELCIDLDQIFLFILPQVPFMSYFKLARWRMKCTQAKNMDINNSRILLHMHTYTDTHTKTKKPTYTHTHTKSLGFHFSWAFLKQEKTHLQHYVWKM